MAVPEKTQEADKFSKHLQRSADQAGEAADAICTSGQPEWMLPDGFVGDPQVNSAAVTEAFSRSQLYDMWSTATDAKDPGTYADIIAITAQQDCLAVAERAFRSRHLSRIRAFSHAAARLKAHSRSGGLFTGFQKAYVSKAIQAGT